MNTHQDLHDLRQHILDGPTVNLRGCLLEIVNILLGDPRGSVAMPQLPTEADPSLVQRVASEIRHRNEDLVPGRIVHVVHTQPTGRVCEAAILTFIAPDGTTHLTSFPPTSDHETLWAVRGRGALPRDDSGRPDTWHFSIACAEVMARARS